MKLYRYSGNLYYDYGGNDHLDIKEFIVRGEEIAFSLASVTQEHGRWEAASGKTAKRQPNGSYLAERVQARKMGVDAAYPWDIEFNIAYEEPGNFIEVSGKLIEGGKVYVFEGEMDANVV